VKREILAMYEILKEILVTDLRLIDTDIQPDASIEDAGLDSLALVELAMSINNRLGIEIADYELMDIKTIGQIVSLMEERTAQV
jgi:acyl carrier protein